VRCGVCGSVSSAGGAVCTRRGAERGAATAAPRGPPAAGASNITSFGSCILEGTLCILNIWRARCLNWSKVTRAHAPRQARRTGASWRCSALAPGPAAAWRAQPRSPPP
jgi:hypothetical protein